MLGGLLKNFRALRPVSLPCKPLIPINRFQKMAQNQVPSLSMNSGYRVPQIGFGTWEGYGTPAAGIGNAVKLAFDVGYRQLDCAHAYENQTEIGQTLKEVFASGKLKREDVFVISKVWNTYHSYQKATVAVDMNLEQLQLSYLDICLIHWPMGFFEGTRKFMPTDDQGNTLHSDVDYLETWRALEDAVKAGKIRSIGFSNFNREQAQRVLDNCTIKPSVVQLEVHPYFPQNELIDFYKSHGVVVTAYGSLGNVNYLPDKNDLPNLLQEKSLLDIAKTHGKSTGQVALRWAVQRGLVVIPKSSKRARIEENFDLFSFNLSDDEMAQINRLDRNLRLNPFETEVNHIHYPFK